jgi:hypothetical protein
MNLCRHSFQTECPGEKVWQAGWFGTAGLVLAAILTAAGCTRRADVGGLVTLDGKPLPTGVVTFTPASGGATGYAAIGEDGRYTVQTGASAGLPPGEYVVTVAANGPAATDSQPGRGPLSDGIRPLVTPQRYADRAESPLRATLQSGTQELRLVLTSE